MTDRAPMIPDDIAHRDERHSRVRGRKLSPVSCDWCTSVLVERVDSDGGVTLWCPNDPELSNWQCTICGVPSIVSVNGVVYCGEHQPST